MKYTRRVYNDYDGHPMLPDNPTLPEISKWLEDLAIRATTPRRNDVLAVIQKVGEDQQPNGPLMDKMEFARFWAASHLKYASRKLKEIA